MNRPQARPPTKNRQRVKGKEQHFLMGIHCGAHVSMHLLKSGWKDLGKLEAEVVSRVSGKKRR